jgi:hypothetical protein
MGKDTVIAGSREIICPREGEGGTYADEVHEADRPSHSRLLGPNGKPLLYETKQPIGFRLSGRRSQGSEGSE